MGEIRVNPLSDIVLGLLFFGTGFAVLGDFLFIFTGGFFHGRRKTDNIAGEIRVNPLSETYP